MHIRTLEAADLDLVRRLRDQAGWNQTDADLRRFLDLAPQGCLVAELGGVGVGTAAAFAFGAVGWIAMVLVDEAHRGQGIGKALMREALAWLDARGVTTVRLDATPLGQPLYASLGFVPEFTLDRYAGTVAAGTIAEGVQPLRESDIQHVLALDRAITGTDRRALVLRLLAEQPQQARVAHHGGRLTGYAAARPGFRAAMIGPCLAVDDSGGNLLLDALGRHVGQAVYVDVPRANDDAVALVCAAGLSPQRALVRMRRGPSVGEQPGNIWASSGPEKG